MRQIGSSAPRQQDPDPSGVPLARSADIAHRRRVYVIQMSIRVVCVLLLPFVPGVWKVLPLIGAVILPYIAVLMANDQAVTQYTEPGVTQDPRELESAPGDGAHASGVVLEVAEDGTVHVVDPEAHDAAADGPPGDEHSGPGDHPSPGRGSA